MRMGNKLLRVESKLFSYQTFFSKVALLYQKALRPVKKIHEEKDLPCYTRRIKTLKILG